MRLYCLFIIVFLFSCAQEAQKQEQSEPKEAQGQTWKIVADIKRYNYASSDADIRVITIKDHDYIVVLGDKGIAICPATESK